MRHARRPGGLAILASLIGLAGCAAPGFAPPVALDAKAERRNLCITSTIGSKFNLQTMGMTAFGNDHKTASIASWGIDEVVTAKLATLSGGSAQVQRIAASGEVVARLNERPKLFEDSTAPKMAALRQAIAGRQCDLLLHVGNDTSPITNTNQSISGLGVFQTSTPFSSKYWLHAIMRLSLYDARTMEAVNTKSATLGQSTFMALIRGPNREVDQSWWLEPAQVDGDARLRSAVRDIVEQALVATLPEVLKAQPGPVTASLPDKPPPAAAKAVAKSVPRATSAR